MNGVLIALAFAISLGIAVLLPSEGPAALVLCAVSATVACFFINRIQEHRKFLLQVFLGGLLVRMLVGTSIFYGNLQEFFGGDALTYDHHGYWLLQSWLGESSYVVAIANYASGWGMPYVVAAIYGVVGRNQLAVQFVNSVVGAATAPLIFLCAQHLFENTRVARMSAILVAFFPSLVLWSSQGLKDGLIIFLLALTIVATLKLRERLTISYFLALLIAVFGIFSLRFYIFYMLIAAILGGFLFNANTSTQALVRRLVVVLGIGLSLTYLGVIRTASSQFEVYGNLQTLHRSRSDMADRADSGFASDADVSTTSGALSTIPVGLTYILLAPFPWQVANLRQSITLPEMLIWWASIPFLLAGLWFTLRYRLRQAFPILLFTIMVTLAYSIFQGNVGTAYRQRAQLLIFYFIFVSVGVVLFKERREAQRRRFDEARQASLAKILPERI
jgi:4-amino-4-deoxy-L-arabinose transferase-like glycosyltransferase